MFDEILPYISNTNDEVRNSNELMKTTRINGGESLILKSLHLPAAIINEEGLIMASNKAWKRSDNGLNRLGIKKSGKNFFEQCRLAIETDNYYALKLILALREILDGNKQAVEINMQTTGDQRRWCKVHISAITDSTNRALILFDDMTLAMETMHSLRETEERFSQNFRHSISGIIIGTPDGTIIEANPAACNILGYTREELIAGGRPLIIDESDPVHQEMHRIRSETSLFEGQKEYIHKNGHRIPIVITSVQYLNNAGEHQILNTFRDISGEKEVQESLEHERRFTQTALNSVPGLFLVLDSQLKIVRWNQAFPFELGYSDEEIRRLHISDLFREKDRTWNNKVLQQILKTGKGNFLSKVLSVNNGIREYHFHVNSFESRDSTYLVITAVDVTDLRESEKEREKNYNLLIQLFENSPLANVLIDRSNIVKKVNEGFLSLFGYSEKEIIGKEVNGLISGNGELKDAHRVSQEAFRGIANQQETFRLNKNKERIPVIVSTVPVFYKGEVIAAYGIYVDLREQKELEKSLQDSLNEKNILLQEVHHRVKNNLAIIAGLLELQMMHENNGRVMKQLSEAHNRVFSISIIHETLYQQKDLSNIQFEEYLHALFSSKTVNDNITQMKITVKNDNNLMLNLNQAVPLSLVLNELLHFQSLYTVSEEKLAIFFSCDEEIVMLEMAGLSIPFLDENTPPDHEFYFKKLLIDTFIKQLDASIEYPENKSGKITIKFKRKKHMKGSSSSFSIENYKQKQDNNSQRA